jgi:hypothetical protein
MSRCAACQAPLGSACRGEEIPHKCGDPAYRAYFAGAPAPPPAPAPAPADCPHLDRPWPACGCGDRLCGRDDLVVSRLDCLLCQAGAPTP